MLEQLAVLIGEDRWRDSFYGEYVTDNDRELCRKVAAIVIDRLESVFKEVKDA